MKMLASTIILVALIVPHAVSAIECYSGYCENGGTCYGGSGNAFCICASDYYGKKCEYKNSCSDLNPCINNATCGSPYVAGPKTYYCRCSTKNVGDHCQYENPCLNATRPCENQATCYHRVNTLEDKAVQYCICPKFHKGDYCEKTTCSVSNSQCFNDIANFGVNVKSLGRNYEQCRTYGDTLIANATMCHKNKLDEFKSKKDCNCDALESIALFGEYAPTVPYPENNVAAHCLATAYDSNVTETTTLPKCPQRTVQCFQCLHKIIPDSKYRCTQDPQGVKAYQKACADDFFAERLQYDNCEYMKTELTVLASTQTIMEAQTKYPSCGFSDHFLSCLSKLKDIIPCGLADHSTYGQCLQESFEKYKDCKTLADIYEKLSKLLIPQMNISPDEIKNVCNQMATFKDNVRSTWSCPVDPSWDKGVFQTLSAGPAIQTGILVVMVTAFNIVTHLIF